MLSQQWIDANSIALDAEKLEECKSCPIIQGYNLEKYQGPSIEEYMKNAMSFPLKQLVDAGLAVRQLEVAEMGASAGLKASILSLEHIDGLNLTTVMSGFRVRDLVFVYDHKFHVLSRATIHGLNSKSVSLLFDEEIDIDELSNSAPFILTRAGSDATYRYNMNTLKALQNKTYNDVAQHFVNLFFNKQELQNTEIRIREAIPANDKLNSQQLKVAEKILNLSSKQYVVVHGPPGSGKTTTIAHSVATYVKKFPNKRVLLTAPSNVAVDNLLLSVADKVTNIDAVRLGSAGRADPKILDFLLDFVIYQQNQSMLAGISQEIQDIKQKFQKAKKKMSAKGDKKEFLLTRKELREANKQLISIQKECVDNVLSQTKVIACTLSGCCSWQFLKAADFQEFDLVVIDEAGQALDIQLLAALTRSKCSIVLAGDPLQLPPTVLSDQASSLKEFSQPLLHRLCKDKVEDDNNYVLLEMQYRFGEMINQFPSDQFYNSRLKAARDVQQDFWEFEGNVFFVDTSGQDFCESKPTGGKIFDQLSIKNDQEANIVTKIVEKIGSDVEIGVIAPYAAQVSLLSGLLDGKLNVEVHTVDGFQGREKDVIIMSMVRSNDQGEVGFTSDKRRLNVSITRAKKCLIIVADSGTLSHDKLLESYFAWLFENATMLLIEDFD